MTVGGAIVALEAEEIVYGAIGLAGSLFGVATLFFLLNAPYVAVFQMTVYVGAVAVLILFTVMLVRQEKWAKEVAPDLLDQGSRGSQRRRGGRHDSLRCSRHQTSLVTPPSRTPPLSFR